MKQSISVICLLLCFNLCYGQRLKTPTLSPFSKISQQVGLTDVTLRILKALCQRKNCFWRTSSLMIKFGELEQMRLQELHLRKLQKLEGKQFSQENMPFIPFLVKDLWTIIIHSNTSLRSIAGGAYKPSNDVFRFEIAPKNNNYVETFTCQFSQVKTNALMLDIAWENTLISIPIEVEVDKKIEAQMLDFMKNPENIPHRTYFEAAQYYSNNGKDLNDALSFIDSALEKSPENFRYGLLKAKILTKMNNYEDALMTVKIAYQWAKNKNNANYIEQTRLFWDSLLTKK